MEVVLPGTEGQEIVVATMVQGQYFGEVELRRGGSNIATIRADRVMVADVAALDRATFERFIRVVDDPRGHRPPVEARGGE